MKNIQNPLAVIGASTVSRGELEKLSCGDLVRLDAEASDLIKLVHDGEVVALGSPVVIDDHVGIRIVKVFNSQKEIGD